MTETLAAPHACSTHAAYKLSCDDFEALVAANNAACWRCGAKGLRLEVDHDHAHGINAVRGLLCRPCNGHMANVDAGVIDPDSADRVYLAGAWHVARVVEYVKDLRTTVRSVRVDDDLWEAAARVAARNRETIADVIRRALLAYAGDELEVTS